MDKEDPSTRPARSGQNLRVLVFGTFDGLHEGHLELFRQAGKLGGHVIAVVARDSTVRKNKNKEPKFSEQERLRGVQECGLIKEALLGQESHDPSKDAYNLIKEIKPDVVCLGYDQAKFKEKLEKELQEMGMAEVEIKILEPFEPEKYHSSIINK